MLDCSGVSIDYVGIGSRGCHAPPPSDGTISHTLRAHGLVGEEAYMMAAVSFELGGSGVVLPHDNGRGPSQEGRILIVAPQPFYEDRGTPIALRQVLEALSGLGRKVDLLTFPVGEDVDLPGLRIFRVANPLRVKRVPVGLSVRKLILDVFLVVALIKRLRRGSYTCIHAVEEAAFPAAVLSRRHEVPLLYDMQSSLPEQLFQRAAFRIPPVRTVVEALERWLLNRADLVVSSAGLGEQVRLIAPDTRVREWRFSGPLPAPEPMAADAVRAGLGLASDQPVVLYSGTFEEYQGLGQLLRAIPLVRDQHPRASFVLVGASSADELSDYDIVVGLQESGALHVVKRQSRSVLAGYLEMADVLVSPRIYGANLPLKIFDYLAAGRPIVATDLPSHRTVLTAERAVLVSMGAEALAEGICAVLHHPDRANRLAQSAREYAAEHLDWTTFVRGVSKLYDELSTDEARA